MIPKKKVFEIFKIWIYFLGCLRNSWFNNELLVLSCRKAFWL
uniref:Uncharacterized protein n=1 Tax=Prochlorococcus marinus str. P0902-H212 TaxID=1620696 RepID=A0A0D5A1M9_PROMR|nr:hypothetical protein FA02_0164 [Prochlorococcus marinus str. P0902-H212]